MEYFSINSEKRTQQRLLKEFNEALKKYNEEDTSVKLGRLEAMMNMMDPEHSIVLNNTIGLLGDDEANASGKLIILNNSSEQCYDIPQKCNWDMVTEDGVTINYKIDKVIILMEDCKTVGYVFGLKGKKAKLEIDSFFSNLEMHYQAYVLWDFKKFYINNAIEEELKEEFQFEPTFEVGTNIVEFKSSGYVYRKDLAHNIKIYSRRKTN